MKLITSVHIDTSESVDDTPVYERLELFDFETIELTSSIQDVRDIASVFTDFSQQFTIPASQVNNRILNHFYNESVVNGYDARIKKRGYIAINGITFREGYIRLSESTLKNGKPYSYSITFFGQLVSLKDILGDDELKSLDTLEVYNHEYSASNVYQGFKTGLFSKDIIYPSISSSNKWYYDTSGDVPYGVDGAEIEFNQGLSKNIHVQNPTELLGISYTELKPAIKVKRIIEAIEDRYSNITFSDDFFSRSNFDELYLLLHNKKGALSNDSVEVEQERSFILDDGTQGVFNRVSGDDVLPLTTNKEWSDTNGYLYRKANIYVFIQALDVDGSGRYTIEVLDNQNNVLETRSYSNTDENTFFLQLSSEESKTWYLKFRISSPDAELNEFNLSTKVVINQDYVFEDSFGEFIKATQFYEGIYDCSVSTMLSEVVIYNQTPKMTIIEFLKGLFKMFNLTAYVEDGQIVIKTLSQYYADGGVIDLSSELDLSEVNVKRAKLYSDIDLKFSEPKTFGMINQNEIAQDDFGNLRFQSLDEGKSGNLIFDGVKYEVKLPFEKLFFERLSDDANGEITPFSHGWLVDKDQNETITKPVLFYNIPTTIDNSLYKIGFKGISESLTLYNRPSNTFSDNSQTLHFGEEIDEFTGVSNENSLYKLYYSDYIRGIFERTSRIVTYNTVLKLNTLLKYKLNDLIIVNGKEYRINSIRTNLNNGKSDVELITNFDILSPVLYVDLTPPTAPTNLSVDTAYVNSLDISWTASTDNNEVVGYEVYVDDVLNFRGVTSTTYEVLGLVGGTSYDIKVLAYDSDNNKSTFSNVVTGTTVAGSDSTPPNPVTDLRVEQEYTDSFAIAWTKPYDNVGVVGYDISLEQQYYASITSSGNVGDTEYYLFENLINGETYRVAIFAKDAEGNISDISNIIDITL